MSRCRSTLFAGVILAVAALLGHVGPAAQAEVQCGAIGLRVTDGASEAGGALIEFTARCKGKETINEKIEATIDRVLVFKATMVKKDRGSVSDKTTVHLPPLPKVPQVCVTTSDHRVCSPPA